MDRLFNKLKKHSLQSFVWRVVGMGCLFAMHLMLANELSPEHYGLFSFVLSIATVMVLLSTCGWPAALGRLVPQYVGIERWGLLKGALIRSHQFSFGLSLLSSGALFGLSLIVEERNRSDALIFSALLLPLLSLIALRRRIFQGLHVTVGSIVPDEVLLPASMCIVLLWTKDVTIGEVVLFYALAAMGVFAATLVWLWRVLPQPMKGVSPLFDSRAWMALALPLLAGGLSQMILTQSGVFLLGALGDFSGAGLFGASFRVAIFATFAMTAINVIGMPMLASLYHKNDMLALKSLFEKTMLWSFLGALPVFLLMVWVPEYILSFFGPGFAGSSVLLQILACGQLVNAAVGLSGSLLVVADQERYFATTMTVCAVLCVVSMVVFIPVWGAVAAAAIYAVCLSLLSLAQFYKARRILSHVA